MVNLVLLIFGVSGLTMLTSFAWVVVFVGVVTVGLTLYGLARQKPLAPVHDQSLTAKDAPLVYALLTPLGLALLYAILFDSSMRITFGRGVTWKRRRFYERAGEVRPPRTGARNSSSSEVDE